MNNFDLHTKKIPSGFKTPDGYFEKFETDFLAKIKTEKSTKTKVFSINQNKRIWYSGFAAALALLFCLPFFVKSNTTSITTVETTTLENYLATEFSSYELAEKLNSDENINFTDIVEVSNADIEAYFEDNQNLENYLSE